jgi:uncharacterized protein YcbK (DUF882 family)
MNNYTISYSFINFSTPIKIVFYRLIIIKISDNKKIQCPEVSISNLKEFTDALEKSYLWSSEETTKPHILQIQETATDRLFIKLARHINDVSRSSKQLIFSSGYRAVAKTDESHYRKRIVNTRKTAYHRGAYNSHLAL